MAEGAGNIEFLGRQPDDIVRRHYQECRAFLFPGEEDFGLTPVEAQACGAPVIAYGAGGATETVVEGRTGVFFAEQTVGALNEAVERFEKSFAGVAEAIRENALRFTWGAFRRGMGEIVRDVVGK
jgi:glycosyltransferase involved in cell wall biosynthesis